MHSNIPSLVLFVLLAGLSCRPSLAAWSDGVSGLDFKYNDLTSFADPSNSSLRCFNACVSAGTSCAGWVFCPAGACCGANATCWLKSALVNATAATCRIAGVTPNALSPPIVAPPRVGAVAPLGWLKSELNVQANGLTGYLADFWPDIANSSFIGGTADGGLHERTPYWLNGLVPLSYLTGDARTSQQRDSYLNYIIEHQTAEGW
jgi:hypothetical protein